MNVSCHHQHGRNSSSHHHTSIMSETHGFKASYGMGSNHMHQWRLWRHKASSKHLQAASIMSETRGSKASYGMGSNMALSPSSGLHHIKQAPSPSSNQSNHQGTIISSPRLHEHHHQLSKSPWTSSTSINLAVSCCDHCKGHHQVSRLHTTVVVIKYNHQAGVGINDNLQQHVTHSFQWLPYPTDQPHTPSWTQCSPSIKFGLKFGSLSTCSLQLGGMLGLGIVHFCHLILPHLFSL
jgi:hypothetical protein